MKKDNINSESINLLQHFAIKSKRKKIIYGDRAITCNRCSDKKQDSLGWQETVTSDFVGRNNWVLVKSFSAKESAKTNDRKQMQEMMKFCIKENISHIVFFSYDRFSREGDTSILEKFRDKGIKVHAATQGADDETPSGRMTQKMYLMFAEMENEQRREKVIEGMKSKLRKGEWTGIPTIGYVKRYITGKKEHDHDKKQCYIDEDGKLLRQAFHWKDRENMSNVEIIDRLKKMGLSIPLTQLKKIFRNPFYCGYITHSLLDEGEIIRGKHEPLISEEVFLRINNDPNRKPYGWNSKRENEEMPLKVSIKCSKCDRPLTAYIHKKKFIDRKIKYIYYKCPNNGCKVNVRNNKLHELFETELSKFSFERNLIPAIKSQLENMFWTIHSHHTIREKPLKDELTRLKNELDAMELNLAIGKVTPEIFTKYSTSHKQKIQTIEDELKTVVNDSSNLNEFIDTAAQNVGNLLKIWQKLDYNGKVRLQKLVYPEGLLYFPETHSVRTLTVNPIFSAITSISQIIESKIEDEMVPDREKYHSVYQMFSSSNFLWDNLLKIQNHIAEIKNSYLDVWENVFYKQINPLTGSTEVTAFNYTSNLTTAMVIQDNINENLFLKSKDHYSGATIHCGR